ncbi:MAG: SAM-dependent methyltransferase [Cyanobium sp. NAT70]|nr:SAM-dependent methyltransferase [Cyanobium sp. NAT70]
MPNKIADADGVAADYYDSSDADQFYELVWGGEDIHIGLYDSPDEPIAIASERTVRSLMQLASPLSEGGCIVDLGSGYGGASRRLAKFSSRPVQAVNISVVENQRHRRLNKEAGLDSRITVHDASFEQVPLEDGCADLVWSQDAILHAGDRSRVMAEVARLLRPGGCFVFTDPMAADGVAMDQLKPILDRIHLPDLASPDRYRIWGEKVGLTRDVWNDKTTMLVRHYSRVREETAKRRLELEKTISADYLDRMNVGLGHWVDGGEQGRLSWGLMRFRKAA